MSAANHSLRIPIQTLRLRAKERDAILEEHLLSNPAKYQRILTERIKNELYNELLDRFTSAHVSLSRKTPYRDEVINTWKYNSEFLEQYRLNLYPSLPISIYDDISFHTSVCSDCASYLTKLRPSYYIVPPEVEGIDPFSQFEDLQKKIFENPVPVRPEIDIIIEQVIDVNLLRSFP